MGQIIDCYLSRYSRINQHGAYLILSIATRAYLAKYGLKSVEFTEIRRRGFTLI